MSRTPLYHRHRVAVALLGLGVGLSACVTGRGEWPGADPIPPVAPTTISVTNDNFDDVKVYIAPGFGAGRRRLGTVTARTTATFVLGSQHRNTRPRLILQRVASPYEEFAEEFVAEPGRVLDVRVNRVLSASAVYQR